MTTDALLTTAAVCALLGVQRNALARYRAAGLPFVVLAPGVYRYRRADLDAWLERRTIVARGGDIGDEEVRAREPLPAQQRRPMGRPPAGISRGWM